MTLEEIDNHIPIGDNVQFTPTKTICDYIPLTTNEEGIGIHLVYYYTGEYNEIDNTYIHHFKNETYIGTYQLTLSDIEKNDILLMCNDYNTLP